MTFAHFDIFAGISGDMILGALVDAGLSAEKLAAELGRMPVPPFRLSARKVPRGEMSGTKVDLELPAEDAHRGLSDIESLLERSPFSGWVKERALAIFRRIAEAESRIHMMPIETIHFHEIGAMDSILDVTGGVLGLELLGIRDVTASSVPLGRGTIEIAHGTMPVPAPATLEILKGIPCRPGIASGEVTTPTGAAFVAVMAREFGDMPPARPRAIGYGAGTREGRELPNLLRVVLADTGEAAAGEILSLEANIDDMNPQFFGHVMERLFEAGALDVTLTPIQMKKNRPGTCLTVLARPEQSAELRDILFAETTTLGVRFSRMGRWELPREVATVETPYGAIRVKRAGEKVAPEYDDCVRAAREHRVPVARVHEEAIRRARG